MLNPVIDETSFYDEPCPFNGIATDQVSGYSCTCPSGPKGCAPGTHSTTNSKKQIQAYSTLYRVM